mmetsp:Transcript_86159/g.278363  ORF Transcript_86159/g.278363 Transcript_86159/m.278363 type:complete len:233 (+) Transcript_86159:6722-7420(+)
MGNSVNRAITFLLVHHGIQRFAGNSTMLSLLLRQRQLSDVCRWFQGALGIRLAAPFRSHAHQPQRHAQHLRQRAARERGFGRWRAARARLSQGLADCSSSFRFVCQLRPWICSPSRCIRCHTLLELLSVQRRHDLALRRTRAQRLELHRLHLVQVPQWQRRALRRAAERLGEQVGVHRDGLGFRGAESVRAPQRRAGGCRRRQRVLSGNLPRGSDRRLGPCRCWTNGAEVAR